MYVVILLLAHHFADPSAMLQQLAVYEKNKTTQTWPSPNATVLSAPLNGTTRPVSGQSCPLDVAPTLPLLAILAVVFYAGWLNVAESNVFPLGDDDDDFEVVPLVERNMAVGLWFADKGFDPDISFPELVRNGCKHIPQRHYKEDRFEAIPPTYIKNCLLEAMSNKAMGWKHPSRRFGAGEGAELDTTAAGASSPDAFTGEIPDLPCPEGIRRRESRHFFCGSQARLFGEHQTTGVFSPQASSKASSQTGIRSGPRPSFLTVLQERVRRFSSRISPHYSRRSSQVMPVDEPAHSVPGSSNDEPDSKKRHDDNHPTIV